MNKWKGIVLAGGLGTRLYPLTKVISKQLLPVYDKPMIYYPISVLMLAEIKNILIITTKEDQKKFQKLLGDGSDIGVNLEYAVQSKPKGIAESFIIGENFIGDDNVCLILGDNIFYGQGFKENLFKAKKRNKGATVYGYQVSDPERFGVVEFDCNSKAISIEEKPIIPKSNYAVTGLYFYDNQVINIAKNIKLSDRGELEITTINQHYLSESQLFVEDFGRGFAWLDTGTHNSLMQAGQFVQTIENRQGFKIACLEEISYRNGWISVETMIENGQKIKKTDYGKYLLELGSEIEILRK
jgi:glucose-1-phosphate thymidylyltransferase